jgi:hypothetical protein
MSQAITAVQRARSCVGFCKQLARFAGGYGLYCMTGRTPDFGYRSFRQLFCRTNGRLNDVLARLAAVLHPSYDLPTPGGVLGALDPARVAEISAGIRDRGFHVFGERLPEDACTELRTFAMAAPCRPHPPLAQGPVRVRYCRERWISTKYDFDEDTILRSPVVQRLLCDASILAVAQAYLGARPVQDQVSMWWSTALSREASSEAAQLYHFDMDRIKFLKFFFYLTDVGSANGPHCYIGGSARRKPPALLRDGRIADDELQRHYAAGDFHELVGERGTILAVDTRGFHKGKPLETGDRLLLQLEFSTSLFGQSYNRISMNGGTIAPLAAAIRQYPYTYSRFR